MYKFLSLFLLCCILVLLFLLFTKKEPNKIVCPDCPSCEQVASLDPQKETIHEQIPAGMLDDFKIVDVYDGDTFHIDLNCSDEIFCKHLPIRVNGVDTPELKTKNTCEHEAGLKAKAITVSFLNSKDVKLKNCIRDKYFRLVCDVESRGTLLSQKLLESKLAYKYDGGTKSKINWCKVIK